MVLAAHLLVRDDLDRQQDEVVVRLYHGHG